MFKDIDLSNDLLGQYKKTCSDEHAKWICPGVDLNVFVLTQAFWPATPSYEITLPSAISELQEHFKAFYLNKFSSRKLQFCNSMGSALLKANYKARRDLIVSMFQSVVLLLFNTADKLSYPEISSSTSLEEEELKKTMQSLVSAKLLFCNSKVLGKEEIYTYNADFKSKMQLSFPVDTGDLKKRIESLIERDYLERDPSNPNMYDYLA
ncbi:ubiquitin-protein ligase, cullin 4 [Pelomyxa schiedti]|nr:ubiquitin-protein ligase, cullin 4 [Pelomyxa schiedti]